MKHKENVGWDSKNEVSHKMMIHFGYIDACGGGFVLWLDRQYGKKT